MTYPVLSCTAIDAREPRALADFYCALLGLHPRPGDEPPPPPAPDDTDWIVLLDSEDPQEPLYVMADPEDHPFCLLVG
ncbi:hypothetical protein GCM10023160_03950 [Brachybacterium paraconglomeratum]|uniref:hypothetical protein n=1 Tax=Brachybacterium paraconglomeratum TaxID=173362 RepID=UPI0031E9FA55